MPRDDRPRPDDVRWHLRLGWWLVLLFLTMGAALEMMHGFKTGFYVDAANETRRLMWTLAHAHGTLLGLLNLGFAWTVRMLTGWRGPSRRIASRCLVGASVLIPAGFFLGGVIVYGGDPGLPIILVPLGAVLLFVAVLLTARAAGRFELDPPSGS